MEVSLPLRLGMWKRSTTRMAIVDGGDPSVLIKKIQNVMKKKKIQDGYEYVLVGTHYSNLA